MGLTTRIASDDGSHGMTPVADPSRIETMLVVHRLLSEESLGRARLVQQETGEPIESVATRLGLTTEQAIARMFADITGLPIVNATDMPQAPFGDIQLSAPFLRDMRVVPIAVDATTAVVALANPMEDFGVDALRFALGRELRCVLALPSDIVSTIDRLFGGPAQADALDETVDQEDVERMKDLVSDAPVIRAVNRQIVDAVDLHASDIHLEPTEDRLAVRFRIDGVLQDRPALPAAMRGPVVSRVKVMAGLNIAERRLPQDGRLRHAVRGHEIDFRVATSPSIHGESIVMRILDRSNLSLDFARLGFGNEIVARFRQALHRPHGIVLVTGPTGSGKTTTLYAALAELNERGRKLLTVEDPIEYRLPGVVQTQVNPGIGLSFSSALRSFLRQDPDVMMVGEIRDSETAQIAVQAALTGHVILSTLHTNTAAGAVSRLIDMGVEPFLLSSVLNAVLAQRLVRRICPECREPSPDDRAAAVELLPTAAAQMPPMLYRGAGCASCGGSGYRGRVALLELLTVTDEVARLILHKADDRDLVAAAAQAGMVPLIADGLAKAADGLTTLAEVLRVARDG